MQYLSQDQTSFDSSKMLKALVTPRPIAFVTSLGEGGTVNAAPYSYFNIVCTSPCILSISVGRHKEGGMKDTAHNIRLTKEFVVNICPTHFDEALNLTSRHYPSHVSEIDEAKLQLLPSTKIAVPRVLGTLAQLECVLDRMIEVGDPSVDLVLGRVVNIHVDHSVIDQEGNVDRSLFCPIARSIGHFYSHQ